jgi:hypothetical protein
MDKSFSLWRISGGKCSLRSERFTDFAEKLSEDYKRIHSTWTGAHNLAWPYGAAWRGAGFLSGWSTQ